VVAELRSSHSITSMGCSGFCYGGTLALHLGQREDFVAAFALAHAQIKVPQDLDAIKVGGPRGREGKERGGRGEEGGGGKPLGR
jgi:dienelactone hydrolase